MQINDQALGAHLQRTIKSIYILAGSDPYLLNEATLSIKTAWKKQGDTDQKLIHINNTADWQDLLQEANSYSLFSEQVLLDVRFDKKTLDSKGKRVLEDYLKNINPRCLLILRFESIPVKGLQWLANNENTVLVQVLPLADAALRRWITHQLQGLRYAPDIPALIQQYTQNNMLACAQVIEKLAMTYDKDQEITAEALSTQLIDQCQYELYELAEACLSANVEKAIHLLRLACTNRTEPTLILWLFTQEIRQLIQLSYLQKQSISFASACSQLKIWPKKIKLYEKTLARLPLNTLHRLLAHSKVLDDKIKTSHHFPIWDAFETLALTISLGSH